MAFSVSSVNYYIECPSEVAFFSFISSLMAIEYMIMTLCMVHRRIAAPTVKYILGDTGKPFGYNRDRQLESGTAY
jgi:hypothetical protein